LLFNEKPHAPVLVMHHLLSPSCQSNMIPSVTNRFCTNPSTFQIKIFLWRARKVSLPQSDQILNPPLQKCNFWSFTACISFISQKVITSIFSKMLISCRAALACTIHGPLDFNEVYWNYHFTNLNTNSNDSLLRCMVQRSRG
jgi:hypothetical protein